MTRITGQAARELLDDFNNPRTPIGDLPVRGLLETVAWLYGAEVWATDDHGPWWRGKDWEAAVEENGTVEVTVDRRLAPDEAVDLARALLAAAGEARRDQ